MPTNYPAILLVVLYVVYPIVSFIYLQKLYSKLEHRSKKPSSVPLVLVLLSGLIIAVLGVYSYGVWWLLMIPLYLISPIIGIIALLKVRSYTNTVFGALLIISFLTSPFQSFAIAELFDGFARFQANELISGIERYKTEQGNYPEDFSRMYAEYVDKMPVAAWLKPYRLFGTFYRDYKLEFCEDRLSRLVVHSMDLNWVLIYHFPYQNGRYTMPLNIAIVVVAKLVNCNALRTTET